MLLFGMINWLFTWMRPTGGVDYDAMAQMVADLFLGGLGAVKPPPPSATHQNR
jgi:Tetracyclin repressor-like, C-terminal domain